MFEVEQDSLLSYTLLYIYTLPGLTAKTITSNSEQSKLYPIEYIS